MCEQKPLCHFSLSYVNAEQFKITSILWGIWPKNGINISFQNMSFATSLQTPFLDTLQLGLVQRGSCQPECGLWRHQHRCHEGGSTPTRSVKNEHFLTNAYGCHFMIKTAKTTCVCQITYILIPNGDFTCSIYEFIYKC